MKTTLTFSNRHLAGEYKPTTLDLKKSKSNRLTSICGKYYTVVTPSGERLDFVGKRSFNSWSKKNTYITDF